MRTLVILNGMSCNLKSTLIKHIAPKHSYRSKTSKIFEITDLVNKNLTPSDLVIFKLMDLLNVKSYSDEFVFLEKSLIESLAFNRMFSVGLIKYKDDHYYTDEEINSLLEVELEHYKSQFDKIIYVLLETHDTEFLDRIIFQSDDEYRSNLFYSVENYLQCQEFFRTMYLRLQNPTIIYHLDNLTDETIEEHMDSIDNLIKKHI